ncbi:hypothetical protein BSZ37_00625 [Rubrivirga marina]|uniref:Cytochrome c domain-containing protein n=1 Tax=Rubrivirga marina TaxID=1196024 RepID=A0A271J6B8_9BACT|nr:hypothetical protein BSZ37_00625 [Rubrivirga marina]
MAGRAVAGLALVVAVLAVAVYGLSERRLAQRFAVPEAVLLADAETDSAAVARGAHLAVTRGCTGCHAGDLGGKVMIDDPAFARIVPTNLTPGGRLAGWTARDVDRAVRHGVAPDGRGLLLMPSHEYHGLSDRDVADLVAYLQTVRPVERALPASRVGPVGRALFLAGQVPLLPAETIPHAAPRAAAPEAGPTVAYGAYLATSCQGCHGPDLAGAPAHGPDGVPAPDLTATGTAGRWTEAAFAHALRTGLRPDAAPMDSLVMPWTMTRPMSDDDLRALYLYLRALPERPAGDPLAVSR